MSIISKTDISSSFNNSSIDGDALHQALAVMIKNHALLNLRLVEVPYAWNADAHRISGTFYYMAFANGVPTTKEFIDYIYDCLIPYCLPKKKYESVLASLNPKEDYHKIVRLGDEAKALFIKAKNQLQTGGEAGELILYALTEWALNAPRFVSKMYLKTNNNMPVHGTDGIHLGYDKQNDIMTIYFGESKIYKDFSDAASSAFSSMMDLINNTGQIDREIEILNNLSDLDVLEEPFKSRIIDYINPYPDNPSSLNKRIVHSCLLGFEYSAYNRILLSKPSEVASIFEAKYSKRIASACRNVQRQYKISLPTVTNLHLFLLPFPSVQKFREDFYGKLGIVP